MEMTMEELQMLEVEETEENADFCSFTCLVTCSYTSSTPNPDIL